MPFPHCSILLVERDKDLREILTRALLRRGFRVTAVEHPRQALEAATIRRHQVAILDQVPSDQPSDWLMRKLKCQTAGLQVILLAAYWDETSQTEATSKGAFACLGKPCALSELVEAISNAYDQCRLEAISPTPAR